MSILTFNMSVSDREAVATNTDPFQIMPATTNYLFDGSINKYIGCNNPKILLHMNYITRVFGEESIANMSKVRSSLKQYRKLGEKLGTKNILIHAPYTVKEWENLKNGMQVIAEEIAHQGFVAHIEVPAWSKDMQEFMNQDLKQDPKIYLVTYIDEILKYESLFPNHSLKLVMDTAHLFANGCKSKEDFEFLFDKYRPWMEYVHLNGNKNAIFKTDAHVPIYNAESKLRCWQDVAKLCSTGFICIAEVTKVGSTWKKWEDFATEFGYKLVKKNDEYMY